jgi:vacuolar-type H+-ATPase subunit I/STV1
MKRILAIILTTLMLFGTFTLVQAEQTTTTTTTATTTTSATVTNPTDPLIDLIANETNTAIKGRLQTIVQNRQTIIGLRETFSTKVQALKQLIANMPEDDDNEALEEAKDIIESFEGRVTSGIEHDQNIQRKIEGLRTAMPRIRQQAAEQNQNNANNNGKRTRIRNGRQNNDNERNNGNARQNMRQNRRSERNDERNEQKILRRIDQIIRSQQRIIDRLETRIDKVDDLIDELTP